MEREQLIILVADIRNHRGSDEELLKLIETFNKEVPYPNSFDLILTDLRDLSSEEVVDIALAYKPQILDWSHNS